jgi:uncharacterized protein involved in outer membrane biogenesis
MWHHDRMVRTRKLILILGAVALAGAVGLALTVRVLLGGDRIRVAVEAQASAALGRPVTIASAKPKLFPRIGLELAGIGVGAGREVTVESARLSTGLLALLRGRVEDADISIERSRIDVRFALDLLSALGGVDAAATAATPGPLVIESIGSLALGDVTLVAGSRTLLVDLESSFTGGDRLVINRMHGHAEGTDLVATGELTSIARRTGRFAVEAKTLDLDGLMAFLAAATPMTARNPAASPAAASVPLQIDLTVQAPEGRVLGIGFTNLQAKGQLRGAALALDELSLEAFGGRFSGAAGFDGAGDEPTPTRPGPVRGRYEWRGSFEHLDVPALVAFAGSPGSMTGRLSGTVALTATGVDPLEAVERARGQARVAIVDGRVPGLDLVRTVVLAFGKPSGVPSKGSGESFTRLAASLAVEGATLSTSDLTFASRDVDMTGAGTLSLATKGVDLRTNVMLSRELSAQAGRDLYRVAREGDRIVLPARIGGTVSSPTVVVDVQAALERAIRNKAEDELKSFLQRLGKRIK